MRSPPFAGFLCRAAQAINGSRAFDGGQQCACRDDRTANPATETKQVLVQGDRPQRPLSPEHEAASEDDREVERTFPETLP